MSADKFITEVVTVGGEAKAESIRDATKRLDAPLTDVMYVGDSITDVEAFRLVRNAGGLTFSFNGNSYAVRNAEVAVMSESNIVVALLADLFCRLGTEQTLRVIQQWSRATVEGSGTNVPLLKQLKSVYPSALPKVEIVTAKNVESLIRESSEFRRKVRGVAIGGLG
jgi:energy-converting hydrogenase A subunit R